MNIKDLEFGNVVKLRSGNLCLIHPIKDYLEKNIEGYLLNHKIYDVHFRNLKNGSFEATLNEYNDKKNSTCYKSFDIMEIYEDYTLKKLLWKREEETEEYDDYDEEEDGIPFDDEKWEELMK